MGESKRRSLVLSILLTLLLLAPGFVKAGEWAFKTTVQVLGGQVSLANLVDGQIPVDWQEIFVASSPKPGGTTTLTSAQVKWALRQAGVDPETVTVAIPARITLTAPGQEVTAAQVRSAFYRQLLETLGLPVVEFHLELVGWPEVITVSPGEVEILVIEDPDRLRDSLFRSYATFSYQVNVDGETAESGRARVRLSGSTQVPVLVRDLQRNEIVTRQDLEIKEVELTRIKDDTFMSVEGIVGYRTTRLIRKGLPLKGSDLEVPPLVQYNSRVRLIATYREVYIETVGKALMDGGLGEIVRVENVETGRIVSAEVVGPGEVQALL